MDIDDDAPETPDERLAGIAPVGMAWGHVTTPDERSPEAKAEAERMERRRRSGKVRGRVDNWWVYTPTPA